MARKKAPTYSIDSTKEMSNRARYEYWRESGIAVADAPLHYLTGKELDAYTDKCIWEQKHPDKVAKRVIKVGKARGVQTK